MLPLKMVIPVRFLIEGLAAEPTGVKSNAYLWASTLPLLSACVKPLPLLILLGATGIVLSVKVFGVSWVKPPSIHMSTFKVDVGDR